MPVQSYMYDLQSQAGEAGEATDAYPAAEAMQQQEDDLVAALRGALGEDP